MNINKLEELANRVKESNENWADLTRIYGEDSVKVSPNDLLALIQSHRELLEALRDIIPHIENKTDFDIAYNAIKKAEALYNE